MEKITRLSLVLGLGLITSLAYGQEEKKKEEVVPSKKPVELKEKPLTNIKPAQSSTAPKEETTPTKIEKQYGEPTQTMQKAYEEQPSEKPQQPAKPSQSEKQKAETVPLKPAKAPVSPKPVEAAPEKKTPPPPAEQK